MKHALLAALFAVIALHSTEAQSVQSQIEKAEERLEHDDWVNAIKDFEGILEKYKTSLTTIQKANVYNDLGYLKMRLLDLEEAEYYLNLSIISHEEAGLPEKINYASALQNMSTLFLQRIQYDLAKNYVDQALAVIVEEKGKDNADYAIARTRLAMIFEEVGYYGLAYEIFFDSHEALRNLGAFSPDYAEACNHMGRILIRQGDPAKAEEYINESTVIYKQLGKDYDVERAESLEGLGNFYEQLGRYEDAEKTLLEALAIKRSIPNEANILIIETLNDLGILYRHLGDDIKAENMFQEVVKECEEELTTDHPFYATAKNNLATIAMQNGDNQKAKTLLEEALETYDKKYGPNHPLSANTLNNLARVQRQLGNNETAEEYYRRVLILDERLYGRKHPDYATTLMNLAILYSSSGRQEEADKFYAEALEIRKEVLGENHPSYYRALENVGLHSIANGKLEEAEDYFRQAIEIQIRQVKTIFPALPLAEKEYFFDRLREDVDRYNFIAFSLLDKRPELINNIFNYQLRTKSILFSPDEKIENRITNGSDKQLRSDYFDWREKKQLLANYYRIGTQRLQENSINLPDLEAELEQIESSLISRMSDFANIIPDISKDWKNVQDQVKQNEAIVEIVKIREFQSQTHGDGIVFGFTNSAMYLAILFNEGTTTGPKFVKVGDDYQDNDNYESMIKGSDEVNKFNLLWAPIHNSVGKIGRIKVSPDGVYHILNPNSLKSGGKYLIDEYYVTYLTSCHDLFRKDQEILAKKSLLFGNPDFRGKDNTDRLRLSSLMSSELEINSIAALLQPQNWDTRIFARKDATELRIKSAFNPTILHISSHGFNDDDEFISTVSRFENPSFQSGIYMAGASNTYTTYLTGSESNALNDGMLTTYEAMGLDLQRTKLVVLSAPNSRSDFDGGYGVYGLQRAFMVAGAQNLLANFSKTNETAASELMVLFYHKYMETENASESLRFAQIKLRSKYDDPKIWGSFMLYGNG